MEVTAMLMDQCKDERGAHPSVWSMDSLSSALGSPHMAELAGKTSDKPKDLAQMLLGPAHYDNLVNLTALSQINIL